MDPNDVLYLARQIADLDLPGTLRCAARLADVADHLRGVKGEAPGDTTLFDTELELLGEGAWWLPGRNLAAHRGKDAWTFWSFTLLPSFASKRAYRDDLGSLIIRPAWRLAADRTAPEMTTQVASAVVDNMRNWPTLEDTVRREVSWVESSFGVMVPEAVTAKLVEGVEKQARLRWGVNRLKIAERLLPLDGGAPRDLGAWE